MRNKVKAFYKTATLLFAVLGLFGLIYCGVIAIKLADVLKYTNWLETGSVASAAIIASFSCAACVFGGISMYPRRKNSYCVNSRYHSLVFLYLGSIFI